MRTQAVYQSGVCRKSLSGQRFWPLYEATEPRRWLPTASGTTANSEKGPPVAESPVHSEAPVFSSGTLGHTLHLLTGPTASQH